MDAALEQLSQLAKDGSLELQRQVIVRLRRLADSLEDPIGTIHRFGHIELVQSMIKIGLDLNIFNVLSSASQPLTVEEIARQVSIDPTLMKRILRYYHAVNVARETSLSTYEATNVTKNLTKTVTKAALSHYFGIVSDQYRATASYLKNNGYQNPVDEEFTAFHEGHRTRLSPFQWMEAHPEQLEHFHTYMSLRRQAELSWLSVYPVRKETAGLQDASRPLYVNIGGGIGHQCVQFMKKYPDLPGRVILQDLPATVARALSTEDFEVMAMDFFEPQPVKGAKFYHMRGVPHNHPPHKVKKMFEIIKDVMASDSILLVDETVLPESNVGFVAASIDLTMLGAFASMERTEKEWRQLIDEVGLELTNVLTYNSQDNESVMDIRLPRGIE